MIRTALLSLGLFLALGIVPANAAIVPKFDYFGDLDANFGGTGIPTDAVAVTKTSSDEGPDVTLGLTAHGRFANPALTNDGAGRFTAGAGANYGGPGDPSALLGALWNVAFYVKVAPGPHEYTFTLLYDFNPGPDTPIDELGIFDLTPFVTGVSNPYQDSQNMFFGFLASNDYAPIITPPDYLPFDPTVAGEYSFALIVSEGGDEVGRAAIIVNVESAAVPEPASLAVWSIVACVFCGVGIRGRLRRTNLVA